MNDRDKDPYNDVDIVKCKFCDNESNHDFCSHSCMRAYWSEMD